MPPIKVNRRRFIGCSAAAGLALGQGGGLAEAVAGEEHAQPVRMGVIGLGNRGTALLRQLLDLPAVQIVAVGDAEIRHGQRAEKIVEKVRSQRPEVYTDFRRIFDRHDVEAVAIALPCDLHESSYLDTIRSGKNLYAEKPLAITQAACDRLIAASSAAMPGQVLHVGFQRRSNPRFREAVDLIRRGELGALIEARATWTSSNGPLTGHHDWLGRRARSGDWMVEQGVHIWDVLAWIQGEPPVRASGWGRRDLFTATDPARDVTDHYAVELEWADGFRASFVQSWIAPADDAFTGSTLRVMGTNGGFDFSTGSLTLRDRSQPRRMIHPGPQADTRLALEAFLAAVRSESPVAPPLSLADARTATEIGLMVRTAVDERRVVTLDDVRVT